ncbi:hypothetical protein CGC56_10175 [Capnocytophaga canimorsus]|uniref:Uncharacterized protein n=1 Tax=Capnocytophaga canimorsus TaxID=28188 RepID=A0A250G5B3_9FLAO|nr:hypothetical protein CGC56_10175 [Capnocytophaga canimorsus]
MFHTTKIIIPCLFSKSQDRLDNFILLKYYSELFNEINTLNIYYNKYFWYSKMKFDYINKYGKDDLNFEQGQFKLIEEGEQYENVDWSIIEDIHKQFET